MEIFISWSGDISKRISEQLKQFLPSVIQALKPFYSSEDIAKGKRWSYELSKKLSTCDFGLVVLTKDNLESPWIMFEAGALSKNIESGRVCTLLFDIVDTDVQPPLTEFQNTKFNENEFFNLVKEINSLLGDKALDFERLKLVFSKMWPDFDSQVKKILTKSSSSKTNTLVRSDRELLEESLRYLRQMTFRNIIFENTDFEFDKGSKVIFSQKKKSIIFYEDKKNVYEILLSQLNTTAQILDFIFQVHRKGWCTSQHIKQFIDCLEEISKYFFDVNAQGIICPFGSFKRIDWLNRYHKGYEFSLIPEDESDQILSLK